MTFVMGLLLLVSTTVLVPLTWRKIVQQYRELLPGFEVQQPPLFSQFCQITLPTINSTQQTTFKILSLILDAQLSSLGIEITAKN